MNHKIKMLGDWKVPTIPDLIYQIRDIHEKLEVLCMVEEYTTFGQGKSP
jgi:hypothetical protein